MKSKVLHAKRKIQEIEICAGIQYDNIDYTVHYTVGVAKIFRFTCTLFWSIPTYSRTHLQSFSEK